MIYLTSKQLLRADCWLNQSGFGNFECIVSTTKKICNKEHATNGITLEIKKGFFIKRTRNLKNFYCKSILYYVIRCVQMFPFAKLLLKKANNSKTRRDRHFKFRLKSDSTSKSIQLQLVFIFLFADARKTVSRDAIFRGIKSHRNRILSLRPHQLKCLPNTATSLT